MVEYREESFQAQILSLNEARHLQPLLALLQLLVVRVQGVEASDDVVGVLVLFVVRQHVLQVLLVLHVLCQLDLDVLLLPLQPADPRAPIAWTNSLSSRSTLLLTFREEDGGRERRGGGGRALDWGFQRLETLSQLENMK